MKIRTIKINLLVGLVVLFNIISILSYKMYGVQNIESDGIPPFKPSETLTEMDPILIDDSLTGVGAHNWSWAASQSWCRGSGNSNDPYVIENLKIDGNKTATCIHIKNSGVFFRIENCTLYNSKESSMPNIGAGIILSNVANGTITNNNCSFNQFGIYLGSCKHDNISSNYIANNSGNGIYFYITSNCRITGNTMIHNCNGIYILSGGGQSVISRNIIQKNNLNGISLYYGGGCQILDNTILENKEDGISFGCSDNSIIVGNVIRGCGNYGIFLLNFENGFQLNELSQNNHFYENYLRGNGVNAYDSNLSANNKWNNSAIGNYWDDYPGVDANSDGIGDTPYNINLLPLIQDYLPIYDETAPNITIITPTNNSVFGSGAPEFSLNISDTRLYRIWLTLDGGKTNYSCSTSGTINQDAWDALNESKMILRFYAEDKPGNVGFQEIMLIYDVTRPNITIITPTNNSVFGSTAPEFTLNVTDPHLYCIWYTLDGGKTNYSCSTSGTINQEAWDALNEGKIILQFYAEDTAGNVGFQAIILQKSITNTFLIILILLGVIISVTVISVIIIRKRSKKEKGHWITKDGRRIFIKD